MIVKAKQVIGLPIYTIQLGQQLTHAVKDVVYDPKENKVQALVIDDGGWFSDAKVILLSDVHSIGDDAIIIENDTVIKSAKHVKPAVTNVVKGDNYLTADKVITEDGSNLGTISDIYFDTATGLVEEFEVTQGAIKDIGSGKKTIKTTDIITVGRDAMIVGAWTESSFEKQAKERGLNGTFNQTKHSVQQKAIETKQQTPSLIEQIRLKAQELGIKTQEKMQEMKDHPKTREMMQSTRENLKQLADTTREKAQEAKQIAQTKTEQGKTAMQKRREADVLGKYVTINVLSQSDEFLAKRGDMVTHTLLEEAKTNNVIEQVLGNVSDTPITEEVPAKHSIQHPEAKSFQTSNDTASVDASNEDAFVLIKEEEYFGDFDTPLYSEQSERPFGMLGGKSSRKHTKKEQQTKEQNERR